MLKRKTPLAPGQFSTLARRTPMKRTGFSRKSSPSTNTADRKTSLRRSEMKRRVKKPTVAEGSKYLAACRGEECYLLVPGVCCSVGWAHRSVVPCHSNQERHGKGGNLKADNEFTVPGCGPCHAWIDQNRVGTPRQVKFDVWDAGYDLWVPRRARKMGLQQSPTEVA
jgi:hypothetical protein